MLKLELPLVFDEQTETTKVCDIEMPLLFFKSQVDFVRRKHGFYLSLLFLYIFTCCGLTEIHMKHTYLLKRWRDP